MRVRAYAKVNLVLNVLNKRDDGYHEIDFLMATANLYDTLDIKKATTNHVECINAPYVKMESNLCYLAWLKLQEMYNLEGCIDIKINKKIPVAAGMAGGSADCAATILAINEMFNLNLSLEEMAEIGATLGSDVPFCIYSTFSRAQGRGEKMTVLNKKLPKFHLVIINPGVALSTPSVFKNHVITNNHGNIDKFLEELTYKDMLKNLHNDLEETAIKLQPSISEIKDYIAKKYDNKVLLSGSGPTILVFCEELDEMYEIYNYAKKKYNKTFFAKDCG